MDLKKAGYKKQVALLFLNNNDTVFAPCFYQVHILDLTYLKFQILKKYWVDLIN